MHLHAAFDVGMLPCNVRVWIIPLCIQATRKHEFVTDLYYLYSWCCPIADIDTCFSSCELDYKVVVVILRLQVSATNLQLETLSKACKTPGNGNCLAVVWNMISSLGHLALNVNHCRIHIRRAHMHTYTALQRESAATRDLRGQLFCRCAVRAPRNTKTARNQPLQPPRASAWKATPVSWHCRLKRVAREWMTAHLSWCRF